MAPAGPEHADVVAHVGRILRTQTTFLVREEKPVTLPEYSELEPDIALVKPRRYLDAHPFPYEVLMIIEVADTSLDKDKTVKVPLYARFRIPEVWIADLQGRSVECFWDPSVGTGFSQYVGSKRAECGLITSETIPGIAINLDELWKDTLDPLRHEPRQSRTLRFPFVEKDCALIARTSLAISGSVGVARPKSQVVRSGSEASSSVA